MRNEGQRVLRAQAKNVLCTKNPNDVDEADEAAKAPLGTWTGSGNETENEAKLTC